MRYFLDILRRKSPWRAQLKILCWTIDGSDFVRKSKADVRLAREEKVVWQQEAKKKLSPTEKRHGRSQDGHTLPTEAKSILVCVCFFCKNPHPHLHLPRSLPWTSSLRKPDLFLLTWLWLTAWLLFTSETMFKALIPERGCLLRWFAYRREVPRYASLRWRKGLPLLSIWFRRRRRPSLRNSLVRRRWVDGQKKNTKSSCKVCSCMGSSGRRSLLW